MRKRAALALMLAAACGPDSGTEDAPPPDGGYVPARITRVDNNDCFRIAGALGAVVPTQLSATGCFTDLSARTPAAPLVPFDINSPLWSDGAEKERFLVLPSRRSTIRVPTTAWTPSAASAASGAWELPDDTVLVKTFLLPFGPSQMRPVETRFLYKRDATTWEGYSYRWNDSFTDATLNEPDNENFDGTTDCSRATNSCTYTVYDDDIGGTRQHQHIFPTRTQCLTCHGAGVGVTLGLRTVQMNRDNVYDGGTVNQIDTYYVANMFAANPGPSAALARMPHFLDGGAPLEDRARAYAHANCSHCHSPGGFMPSMDWRFDTPLAQTNTVCVDTFTTVPELTGPPQPKRIFPGDPQRSMVWQRMNRRGAQQMPQIGTLMLHQDGLDLIADAITDITPAGCN